MNNKLLLLFSMLVMLAYPGFLFADSEKLFQSDQDSANQMNRSNSKAAPDEDDEPPAPIGMIEGTPGLVGTYKMERPCTY